MGPPINRETRERPGVLPYRIRLMFNITKKSIQWGEETLTLETGKVARQADGSVVALSLIHISEPTRPY